MRVILADHNRSTVWALQTLLEEEPNMEVVGEATDAQKLLQLAEQIGTDLVLVDKGLAEGDIRSLIAKLHALCPRPIVVVMSSASEDSRVMLRAGADAFVSKGEQPDWLLQTLREFANRSFKVDKDG